jgi:arylsulfatase A
MNRVASAIASVTVALLFCASAAARAEQPAKPPNIVLIFIDDMGYGDIGPFGNTMVRTPHLDQMAKEGMKFNYFYATPVCSMSRACLMTGCYNVRVSIPGVMFPGNQFGLNPSEITLAEVVKQKNYATICIGKWHLGHREPFLPTKQGFDSYFGIPYSNDMTIDKEHAAFAKDCVFREGVTARTARAETLKNKVPLMRGSEVVEYPADQSTLTKRYTEEAVKFIREHKDGPFFVYLPHNMVHVPLAASEAFKGKSKWGLIGDAIEEVDWSVGQIMQALKDLKLDDNTLVIFTSDNGAASGSAGPLRGKKGSVFEGGVREPCIMRWPGKVPAGTTCNQIAGNIDVLPTFCKLIGVKPPEDRVIDGRDITSLMFDPKAGPVRDVHLYFNGNSKLAAIRQGDWKLLIIPPAAKNEKDKKKEKEVVVPSLFNLADDLAEKTDVAAKHPDIVAKLRAVAAEREAEINKNKRPHGTIDGGK